MAQVEPGPGLPCVRIPVRPGIRRSDGPRGHAERCPRAGRRPRDHGGAVPPALSGPVAELPPAVFRRGHRGGAALAGDRSPDPAGAHQPLCGLVGGRAARTDGERRRGAPAHREPAGIPGERTVRRRAALPAGAGVPAAPADPRAVRGRGAPRHPVRTAGSGRHRLGHRLGRRDRRGAPPAQREGAGRARRLPRRRLPGRGGGVGRGDRGAVRRIAAGVRGTGEAAAQVPPRRRVRDLRDAHARGRGGPAVLRRQHHPVHDAGAGAREPHPPAHRGRGRGRCGGPGPRAG